MGAPDRAAALRMLRTYRHLTQRQLADSAGISKATVSSYERGRQEIGPANLRKLLDALAVTLADFGRVVEVVERLGSPTLGTDPDEIARRVGHHAEQLVRAVLGLFATRGPA